MPKLNFYFSFRNFSLHKKSNIIFAKLNILITYTIETEKILILIHGIFNQNANQVIN